MKRKFFLLLPLFFLLAGSTLAYFIFHTPLSHRNDMVSFNRIVKEASTHWPNPSEASYGDFPYPFSIISMDGWVLYQSESAAVTGLNDALAQGNTILEIEKQGEIVGRVIITNNPNHHLSLYRNITALFILSFTILLFLSLCLYFYYLEIKIMRPFQNLEKFASEVANGNLDFPLKMKKNNLFGAFTESFDIMREQLMLAKEREFQANRNQKELVASLSHDIKTPITSIRLTSELLLALEQDEHLKIKIRMIYQKTEQIEELVTNLFQTTLQDMEQLTVTVTEQYSTILKKMIQDVDFRGKAILSHIPDCILLVDEIRLTQILSNIFSNSYKYANSEITVNASITDTYLSLSICDFGQTAAEEELPYLFNKFYRGSNAAKESGSGLGLYICKKLIEQMQGKIYCTCSKDGFTVVLLIRLV